MEHSFDDNGCCRHCGLLHREYEEDPRRYCPRRWTLRAAEFSGEIAKRLAEIRREEEREGEPQLEIKL